MTNTCFRVIIQLCAFLESAADAVACTWNHVHMWCAAYILYIHQYRNSVCFYFEDDDTLLISVLSLLYSEVRQSREQWNALTEQQRNAGLLEQVISFWPADFSILRWKDQSGLNPTLPSTQCKGKTGHCDCALQISQAFHMHATHSSKCRSDLVC